MNLDRAPRYAVYRPGEDKPFRYEKWKLAEDLLRRGRATLISPRAIRLVVPDIAARSSELIVRGVPYGALDVNATFVQGGLARTEKKPQRFSIAQGAKVGHQ